MQDPVEFLKEILEIYSPSGKEDSLVSYLKSQLEEYGLSPRLDEVGNLIVEIGQGPPTLLFSSHLDTIPGKLPIKEENGRIYGRGAVDDKATTIAMLWSIIVNRNSSINGKLIYIGIIEEESSLRGIEQVIQDRKEYNPEAVIFGEPSLCDRITTALKGRILSKFEISSSIGTGHVASSWLYPNPLEISIELWNRLKEECQKFGGNTPFEQVIPNITKMISGTILNTTPEKSEFYVDFRIPLSYRAKNIEKLIEDLITELKSKAQTITIKHEILSRIEPYQVDPNAKILRITKKSIFKILGQRPRMLKKTGTNFMNIFGERWGIPVISYGAGDPKIEHTKDEFVEIADFLRVIEVYKKIIELYLD